MHQNPRRKSRGREIELATENLECRFVIAFQRQLLFRLFFLRFLERQTATRQVGIARGYGSIEQSFDSEYLKLGKDRGAQAFVETKRRGFFFHRASRFCESGE